MLLLKTRTTILIPNNQPLHFMPSNNTSNSIKKIIIKLLVKLIKITIINKLLIKVTVIVKTIPNKEMETAYQLMMMVSQNK